jgi:DNA-binding transcriptional ArsR family regulator
MKKTDRGIVFEKIASANKNGQMLNIGELARALKMPQGAVEAAVILLRKDRAIYSPSKDAYGPVWAVVPVINPKKGAKATKKAIDWNQNKKLVTPPKPLKIADNLEFLTIGDIVAIEYESNKFDGKKRVYRHDVTKNRTMSISTDGSVIIVKPGFKITKRGIEG